MKNTSFRPFNLTNEELNQMIEEFNFMKGIQAKRLYRNSTTAFLVLIFSVFIISCFGQNENDVKQESEFISDAKPIDSQPTSNQLNNQNLEPAFQNTITSDQISEVVRKIFQDKKGNLWLGTQNGAYYYDGISLNHIPNIKSQVGQGVTIKDIAEDKDGNLWFGHTGGVSKYDGESVTNYYEKDGLINNDVWSIAIDHNGILWIGTLQGVSYFNGEKFNYFDIPEGKPDSTRGVTSAKMIHCIMEDSQGRMWFGTNGGAYTYDGKSLMNFSEKDGLCNNNVNSILEDKKGNFWFGTTHKGLCYFDGKSFTNVSQQYGLTGKEVWNVYQDNSENIWVTGKRFGVYRYDGKSFINYNEKNGLASPGIISVLEDKEKRVWFGGVGGLYRFDGESFINVTMNGPWENKKTKH